MVDSQKWGGYFGGHIGVPLFGKLPGPVKGADIMFGV